LVLVFSAINQCRARSRYKCGPARQRFTIHVDIAKLNTVSDNLETDTDSSNSLLSAIKSFSAFNSTRDEIVRVYIGRNSARIDELERSLPELSAGSAKPDASAAQALADAQGSGFSPNSGLLDAVETLLSVATKNSESDRKSRVLGFAAVM
jgi:hypothetical protein